MKKMKKIVPCILCLILVLSVVGCAAPGGKRDPSGDNASSQTASENEKDNGEANSSVLTTFADFIDGEGFVRGVSQGKFIDEIVPQYRYEGKTIPEIVAGANWDGVEGGGWECRGKKFGCSNSYVHGTYTNELYTTVSLDGLDLPYQISFEDSVNTVLQKLGLPSDISELSPDEPDGLSTTLLHDGSRTLKLNDYFRDPIGDYAYRYALIFTEKVEEKTENGTVQAERKLKLYFDNDKPGIAKFSVSVSEGEGPGAPASDPSELRDEIPPYYALLNLEVMNGKFVFQRIATAPRIVYSDKPVADMTKGVVYDDRHEILTTIFQAMNGKDAVQDVPECEFSHYVYMYDKDDESIPWHYRFAVCECGAVMITNNDELLCTIKISAEEMRSVLDTFK